MFDQRQHAVGHEACRAHRGPAASHLGDLDDPAAGVDLDAPTIACRHDVVRADLASGLNDDLDAISSHIPKILV